MRLLLLIILFFPGLALSQSLISSRQVTLENPTRNGQLQTFYNEQTNEFFVACGDQKVVTVYKYNRALFFKDSLIANVQELKEFPRFIGSGFDQNGNPNLYYSDAELNQFSLLQFDFQNKRTVQQKINLSFVNAELLGIFPANNALFLLSTQSDFGDENRLFIHQITDDQVKRTVVELESVELTDQKGKIITVKELLENHPIEFIDSRYVVGLPSAASKFKAYVDQNLLVLTLDHNATATQIISVDLTNGSILTDKILQPDLEDSGRSNSFYLDGNIYQIKLSDTEFILKSTSLLTKTVNQIYSAKDLDKITFSNSTLSMQVGNKPIREFKNTKKFLQKAAKATPAITVYQTPDHLLVTSGATRQVASSEDVALGLLSVGVGLTIGDADLPAMERSTIQSFYFESLFDKSFNHQNIAQTPLAIDAIAQFIDDNRKQIMLRSLAKHLDVFLLTYFDKTKNSLVLRKFEDYKRY